MKPVKTYVATTNIEINGTKIKVGSEFRYDKELDSYYSPDLGKSIPREVVEQFPKQAIIDKDFTAHPLDHMHKNGVPDFIVPMLKSLREKYADKVEKDTDSMAYRFILKEIDDLLLKANSGQAIESDSALGTPAGFLNAMFGKTIPEDAYKVLLKLRESVSRKANEKPNDEDAQSILSVANELVEAAQEMRNGTGFTSKTVAASRAVPSEIAWRAKRVKFLRSFLSSEGLIETEGLNLLREECTRHEKWLFSKTHGMPFDELIAGIEKEFN